MYIYILYTPNLGFLIAVSRREREQGRFRGSSEGAGGSDDGASMEQKGSTGRSKREKGGLAREEIFWLLGEPNLAAPYSASFASVIYFAMLPGSACCWLDLPLCRF